ncbi:hypothetical protein NDU88_004150 [Pleurodeles waltl]|uniref:Uncharacterized protein n=1 Tax=Pleurodeles waltl TaxID=8319 RepID=A0AAV7WXC6_PLEWA|nr:hypothetical protein NDU88_004150 [Pleurodeles waltl]
MGSSPVWGQPRGIQDREAQSAGEAPGTLGPRRGRRPRPSDPAARAECEAGPGGRRADYLDPPLGHSSPGGGGAP